MAMVLSLAGLASATDEVAETTEATATTIEQGSEDFPLYEDPSVEPLVGLLNFVLYWGYPESETPEPPCFVTPDVASEIATESPVPTYCLNVEGPNGQVNHGQFMKAFVHWLKSDIGATALEGAEYEGHRGNLIKQAAHNAFGKGQWKKDKGLITSTVEPLDAETLDVEGPEDGGPNHAYGHTKNKNK